jgi:hypothetical protein
MVKQVSNSDQAKRKFERVPKKRVSLWWIFSEANGGIISSFVKFSQGCFERPLIIGL